MNQPTLREQYFAAQRNLNRAELRLNEAAKHFGELRKISDDIVTAMNIELNARPANPVPVMVD